MAPPTGTLRVGRYFLALLGVFVVLYAVVFYPGQRHTPKLGIDLAGGVRVEFKAKVPKGVAQPNASQMDQARQILEDRINSKGVSGATVVVQDPNELIVEIPSATKADIAQLGKASILNFRGLITPIVPIGCTTKGGTASVTPSAAPTASTGATTQPSSAPSTAASSKAPAEARAQKLGAPATPSGSATKAAGTPTAAKSTGAASSSPSGSAAPSGSASSSQAALPKCTSDPFASVIKAFPTLKSLLAPTGSQSGLNAESCPSPAMPKAKSGATATCNAFSTLTADQQTAIIQSLTTYDCDAAQNEADLDDHYYIACGTSAGVKGAYLLGHVVVPGRDISSADAVAPNASGQTTTTDWSVNLTLSNTGGNKWNAWTSKYNNGGSTTTSSPVYTGSTAPCGASATPCSWYVGFTLDGQVISSPVTEAALDTKTNISGSFTAGEAKSLSQQLNYGKLPISFSLEQFQSVSATLGTTQLNAAFLAGGIGLILVVLYSLLYYRGLGLVTIASLIVSAGLTYALLVILGEHIGFTLDLAGVAGFIVALGITADSFVVFFERIKDEVHEGRSARTAVPRAWVRARRTILSADIVSFLAAAILYFFASADVQGFAFTLGMSTVLDLVVVFLFTHPIVSLFSRSRAFGSRRFTGLDAVRGGPAIADEPLASRAPRRARGSAAGGAAQPAGTAVVDEEDGAEDAPPAQPRTRSTPAGGTAAERAAARRARQREQQSGDGEQSGDEGNS